jgi:hypothetical protein
VGGWPILNSLPTPADIDQDGIPDAWETDHGLNPLDPSDGPAIGGDGYSNLENYLNDIVPAPDADKDHSAPITTAALSQTPNAAGWNNTAVTVTLDATDGDGTGVKEIVYAVNNATFHSFSSSVEIPVTSEGMTTVTWFAKDKAGNAEVAHQLILKIDKTAPVINALRNPPANANGWNNTDVTVSFDGSDALSGIASISGPTMVTTEGSNQVVTGTATDLAGNTASTSVSLNIDKTAPELLCQFDVAGKDIQIIGNDGLSGVAPGPIPPVSVLPEDGQTERRTYRVADLAGNTLTIVLKVERAGKQLEAKIISWAYQAGPGGGNSLVTAPRNQLNFDWATNRDGSLKKLNQTIALNSGKDRQQVVAGYDGSRNETTIELDNGARIIRPGLVLLRLVTSQGRLQIEY